MATDLSRAAVIEGLERLNAYLTRQNHGMIERQRENIGYLESALTHLRAHETQREELLRLGERAALWFADGIRTAEPLDVETAIKCIDGALGALEGRAHETPGLSLSIQDDPLAVSELLRDGQQERERLHGLLLEIGRAIGREAFEAPQDQWPDLIRAKGRAHETLEQALRDIVASASRKPNLDGSIRQRDWAMQMVPTELIERAESLLQSAADVRAGAVPFPQPQRRDGLPPCSECHLKPGETCDICGAVAPSGDEPASAMPNWQPIETAPKQHDGILLTDGRVVSQGGWLSEMDQGADYEGQGLMFAGWWSVDSVESPTHWMPLPSPPQPSQATPKEKP